MDLMPLSIGQIYRPVTSSRRNSQLEILPRDWPRLPPRAMVRQYLRSLIAPDLIQIKDLPFMRLHFPIALFTLVLPLAAAPVWAADITTTSKIDAVTIYRSGAQVARRAVQEIGVGTHTLVIRDLPSQTILGSIRVEGKADGDLQIGAVDSKRVSILSDDSVAQSNAREDLEDELEKLTDAMDQMRAAIDTRETQKAFIANLSQLPQHSPAGPRASAVANHDWSKLLDLIGTSMADVQNSILKTRIGMRELGLRIADVKKKLSELAPKQQRRTEVRVNIEAGADLTANLVIKYQVGSASWRPHYDARLETGSANKPAALLITRRATIQQRTGEAWTNVALKLSTSQPSGKSSAPNLRPLTVDFRRPRPVRPAAEYRKRVRSKRDAVMAPMGASAPRGGTAQLKAVARAKTIVATERGGRLEQTTFQASFAVPGRVSVTNTGEAKRVKLDDQTIKPKLSIRTVPRRDTSAYLYASLEMPKTAPYLAGRVSLFRDGSFMGTGRLPNLAPGASHELGFGSDPSVVVKYHILAEKRGETGIISSSTTDQRNFKIEIANQHARRIDVLVIDQMPVALNEDITVDLHGSSPPSKRNYEDKRGLLAWQFPLEAGKKQHLNFGYTITWPADKKIRYSHGR
jgi:uncharacterized protein (TIGR02231 family)